MNGLKVGDILTATQLCVNSYNITPLKKYRVDFISNNAFGIITDTGHRVFYSNATLNTFRLFSCLRLERLEKFKKLGM